MAKYYFDSKFGSLGTDDGEFNKPFGLATAIGYVFVSDSSNNRIQVFDAENNFLV